MKTQVIINLLNKFRSLKLQDRLKLDNKKIFLFIFACLIIIYIDFTFVIRLQLRNIGTARAKIIKLKKDMDVLTKDLAAMQQAQGEQGEPVKTKKIISEDQIPLLLQDISNIASKYNVKIMQIKPTRGIKTKEEIISDEKLSPLLIALDLFCGYHSLGSFINDLENAEKFIVVQEMKIRRSSSRSSDYLNQDVNLVLKTYVKK